MTFPRMQGRWWVLCLALPFATGCAIGRVRQVRVDALGDYAEARGVAVEVKGAQVSEPLRKDLQASFQSAVDGQAQRPVTATGEPLKLEIRVVEVVSPEAAASTASERATEQARSVLGLSGLGNSGGRLALEGTLLAPGSGRQLGVLRWESAGEPSALAERAGREAGEALSREMDLRREDSVTRRAADERLFLSPTALTLQPGEVVVSNDELLLFRAGVGLGRRVQLDVWGGALPIPVAGGVPLALVHVVGGAGGAAAGALGAFDLGLKVKLLDESRSVPGVAVSYDFLNVFGGALGGAGIVLLGNGVFAAGGVGAAGANLQFNLFSAVAAKHFGSVQLTAGAYLLDNHHFIPQKAAIAVAVSGDVDGSGSASETLPRFPTQLQPFAGVQYVLGPHSELATELFPRVPLRETFGTTGVRWLLGFDSPHGPVAFDRLRVRLDVAALWVYRPGTEARGGTPFPLPWVGLGLYKL